MGAEHCAETDEKNSSAMDNFLVYYIIRKLVFRQRREASMDFGGFLGNDALKRRLQASFRQGKTSHCYLLCGIRWRL